MPTIPIPPPLLRFTNKETGKWYCSYDDEWRYKDMKSNLQKPVDVEETKQCKTLWFAGFYCNEQSFAAYSRNYAAALQSMMENANGLLQPVVMLGTYNIDTKPGSGAHEHIQNFTKWAEARGVMVVENPRLSFQNLTEQYLLKKPDSFKQGPYLRLDIPVMTHKYNLFDSSIYNKNKNATQGGNNEAVDICPDTVMYTDSDVIFWNLTYDDVKRVRKSVAGKASENPPFLAYAGEVHPLEGPINTGVMMLSVSKLEEHLPTILDYAEEMKLGWKDEDKTGHWHDQNLLNEYFVKNGCKNAWGRISLPHQWNYKSYWGGTYHEETGHSTADEAKIIHLHGPKPDGKWFDCMASGSLNSTACQRYPEVKSGKYHPYKMLIEKAWEADGGKLAKDVLAYYNRLDAGIKFW